jgi:Polysaccharide deacetylase
MCEDSLAKLNLKRRAKATALRTLSSSVGSRNLMTKGILRGMKIGYDEESFRTMPGTGTSISLISVDFDVTKPSRHDDNRSGTLELIELARKYGIPITWALCGKSVEEDMKSYEAILDRQDRDELGVHTYSHIDASATSREEFSADLRRCIQTLGLESPRAFVFPWNREGHFDVLREFGFRAFRGGKRVVGLPVLQEGLWNIRPVMYVDQKSYRAEELIKAYIDLCVKKSAIFHLWTHPWSIVVNGDPEPMRSTLEPVFAHLASLRSEGKIRTMTMGEAALHFDTRKESGGLVGRADERVAEARAAG